MNPGIWTADHQRYYYRPWWIEDNEQVDAPVANGPGRHSDLDLPEFSDIGSYTAFTAR